MNKRMHFHFRVAVAFSLLLSCAAQGATRRALVLGNDSYPGNELKNARNDARSMSTALGKLGYIVSLNLDSSRSAMSDAIERFEGSIEQGDTVLIYYAGHGLQQNGENYLIPTDFRARSADDVPIRAYSLSRLLQAVSDGGATTQVVILDACRDSPFVQTRSLGNTGWAAPSTSAGTFLAFGTSPGSTAADEPQGSHGLFTDVLLRYINDSSLDLEELFQKVRTDVMLKSHGSQVPWTASSLIGQLHLDPKVDASAEPIFATRMQAGTSVPVVPGRLFIGDRVLSPDDARSTRGTNDLNADQAEVEAAALVRGMHFDKAISLLEFAVELSPASRPLRLLSMLLAMVGRHEEAVHALDRAVQLDPDDADAYAYKCLLQVEDSPPRLPSDCKTAMSISSTSATSHLVLSTALEAQGDLSSAESEVDKALRIDPSVPAGVQWRKYLQSKD